MQLLWCFQHLISVWLSLLARNPLLMHCGCHKQIEHILGVYESVNQCLIVQFKLARLRLYSRSAHTWHD